MIDEFLQKSKYRKIIIIVGPLAAGLFLGNLLVIEPSLKSLKQSKNEVQTLSQNEAIFTRIASAEQKMAMYRKKIGAHGNKAWLVEQLNLIAEKTKLSITSISPDERKNEQSENLERIAVRIEASGGYHQLGEFVSRIENLDKFIKIVSLEIEKPLETSLDILSSDGSDYAKNTAQLNSAYKISLVVGLYLLPKGIS